MSDKSAVASTPRWKWGRRALLVMLAVVVYPVSVLAVVSLYWLKTDHDYNMLRYGGWHAFSQCLIEQIPVNSLQIK